MLQEEDEEGKERDDPEEGSAEAREGRVLREEGVDQDACQIAEGEGEEEQDKACRTCVDEGAPEDAPT